MTECKFKVGDSVYSIMYGIGKVTEINSHTEYSVRVDFNRQVLINNYTQEGKLATNHANPCLLTLEEARAKGYDVPKHKVKKQVKAWAVVVNESESAIICETKKIAESVVCAYRKSNPVLVKLTGEYEVEE